MTVGKTVSVLGCGWLGLPLALELIKQDVQVKGSTRNSAKASELIKSGIDAHIVDLGENDYISKGFLNSETLIIAVTTKDISGFTKLIKEIRLSPIQHVLFISSTSVYPMTNGMVTEDTDVKDCELVTIENLFRNETGIKTTILRFAGLYGPDRDPGNFLKLDQKIKNPESPINLIHQDDCINLILGILNKNLWREVFNACTEEHPSRREFYSKATKSTRGLIPEFDENSLNEFKVIDNTKIKNAIQYEFRHSI
jgi:nucleoside-diphosphate-sugar epimerase